MYGQNWIDFHNESTPKKGRGAAAPRDNGNILAHPVQSRRAIPSRAQSSKSRSAPSSPPREGVSRSGSTPNLLPPGNTPDQAPGRPANRCPSPREAEQMSVKTAPRGSKQIANPSLGCDPNMTTPTTKGSKVLAVHRKPDIPVRGNMACMAVSRRASTPEAHNSGMRSRAVSTPTPTPERGSHSWEDMPLPTAASRSGSSGLFVPMSRDCPIGLTPDMFMVSNNPFGQQPAPKHRAEQTDLDLIQQLHVSGKDMRSILTTRMNNLRVVSSMWETSDTIERPLEYALTMNDLPVLVDLLNNAAPQLRAMLTLELAIDLMPSIKTLLESHYEDYVITALNAVGVILKKFGPMMKAMAAPDESYFRQEKDLQQEEREEKCEQLQGTLQGLVEHLQALASGKGRSAQVGSRVLKGIEKLEPDTIASDGPVHTPSAPHRASPHYRPMQ